VQRKKARKLLDLAAKTASAFDHKLTELIRYDLNLVNGITNVVKEQKISDIIFGTHHENELNESFIDNIVEGVIGKCNTTTMIYKEIQPIDTIKCYLVILPQRAEREIGFPLLIIKVWNMARNTGAKLVFYGGEAKLDFIKEIRTKHPVETEFQPFEEWDDFLIISREIKTDDKLIIIMSRKERASFHPLMFKIPHFLNKYFTKKQLY
jgi:hypothetical protein